MRFVVASAVVVAVAGCGVAPVRDAPGPPRTFTFVDPHGRPRAWGGGVCPLRGRHEHAYPPTPPEAFVNEDGAWRDTRRAVRFPGPHASGARRCLQTAPHDHMIARGDVHDAATAGAAAPNP